MPSALTILWIYIVFLLAGGLIGFFKGKSPISLVTASIAAATLVLCAIPNVFQPGFRNGLANVVMAALLIVFGIRLATTKKFMPSGMLLVVTLAALILRNVHF